jgi:hypothetical protein
MIYYLYQFHFFPNPKFLLKEDYDLFNCNILPLLFTSFYSLLPNSGKNFYYGIDFANKFIIILENPIPVDISHCFIVRP